MGEAKCPGHTDVNSVSIKIKGSQSAGFASPWN